MGPLPQGFNKKKDAKEGSLLKRYFKEKRPTAELLYATMKRLTAEEGEDILKMASIFMVSQFFGTDDGRKAIPEWMFALVEDEEAFKKFPWGSYIYSITLFWLKRFTQQHIHTLRGTTKEEEKKKEAEGRGKNKMKGEDGEKEDENKGTKGQEVDENKEIEGQQGGMDENKGGQVPEIDVLVKEKKKSKYHTLNIFGFILPFQSTFHTCIQPSTVANLCSTIVSLFKESDSKTAKLIKESEERQLSFFRAELSKIREEMKVDDRPAKKSTEDNSGISKQKNDKVYEEDLNGEILCKLEEKIDVEGDDASNWKMENSDDAHKHSSDPVTDALADSKMVEDVDKQTILNETELKEINKCVDLCIEEIGQQSKPLTKKSVQRSIHLDDVASPSVVAYDVADPRVTYKDQDKARARKRLRYLNLHWVNPLASKRLKSSASDKPSTQGDITDVEFTAFLKTKQPTW
ncbi:hypothetical protein LWI29_026526 [Acer saccharum]|uniref:DUF1985 domain-containing protein n=1 Tax=Acer saccharum TaxID=4024 RepID=A0AA39RIF1_ACESA|nr:hypothetical protein LWI29_026526 [Acer saccharum]